VTVSLGASEEAETDESTGEMQEAQNCGGVTVVAQREATERHDPAQTALDYPPESAESLAGVDAPTCDPRKDAALA
jgi:hypothetical protein